MTAIGRNIRELIQYRALLWALVVRHLSARYRGSLLGFFWSLLNPLCLMLVYTLVFRYYIRFNTVDNYTIFLFCGLLPWVWFTASLAEGTSSIVASGHLITKSMFPAHLLPVVSVLTNMIHFLLALPLLFVFMWFGGVPFHWTLVFVPLLVVVQAIFLQGLTLMLGAFNVLYRDVQHIVSNILTLLFFLCPIVYPATSVPERFRFTLDWNPIAVFTMSYQRLILDGQLPSLESMIFLAAVVILSVLIGNSIFNHYRESFAELL